MPTYEYRCPGCSRVFELDWRDVSTIPKARECPDCGQFSPRKFSNFSFKFSPYLNELREGNMLDY